VQIKHPKSIDRILNEAKTIASWVSHRMRTRQQQRIRYINRTASDYTCEPERDQRAWREAYAPA